VDPTRLMTMPCTITPMGVTSRDAANDDVITAGTPVSTVCYLHQTARNETASGATVDETFALYLPPATAIEADDRITVDGNTYEVDGPPWRAFNPRSQAHTHLEATVRRVA
jgi:hypothetical protein